MTCKVFKSTTHRAEIKGEKLLDLLEKTGIKFPRDNSLSINLHQEGRTRSGPHYKLCLTWTENEQWEV